MAHKEVFEVPDFAVEWVEKVWDGKMRPHELEQVLDLIYWARKAGFVVNQEPGSRFIKTREVQ